MRTEQIGRTLDRAQAQLEREYEAGKISMEEYNRLMRESERDAREELRVDAEFDARARDRWGGGW